MKDATAMPWREVAACPACGGGDFDAIGRAASGFRSNGAAGLDHPRYEVRECRACGLVYKSRVLDSAGLSAYYADLDFAPFDGDFRFPTDAATLARLRTLPKGARVLDFGCSTGRILGHLGDRYERFGVEINATAREVARRRGITIASEADLREARVGRFDAIVVTDVFEHLERPTELMELLASRLASGGRLLIVTGLADAIAPREFTAEYWYFRIGGHLHMLSKRHVDWLARRVDLRIEALEVMSHYRRAPLTVAKQRLQAALYDATHSVPVSAFSALIRATPGVRRAARWTNLPATDQRADHVLAVLVETKAD